MSKYTEVKHLDIGQISWEFDCSLSEAMFYIPIFFDRYRQREFNLFISHMNHGTSGIRIYDVAHVNLAEIMANLFRTESGNRIISISIDYIMRAYIVNTELPMSRPEGGYRVWCKDLVRLTAEEEQIFSYNQIDSCSDVDVVRFNLQAIAGRLG